MDEPSSFPYNFEDTILKSEEKEGKMVVVVVVVVVVHVSAFACEEIFKTHLL